MKRLVLILFALVLSGCNEGANLNDLKKFTENAFKDHIPEVDPLPALQPQAVFIYTASSMVDPFNSSNLKEKDKVISVEGGEDGPDRTRRKEPLELFPFDALKLVGVLAQKGENFAVVKSPEGSVHRVKKGNYMGQNYGEILAVQENTVKVSELVLNPVGRWEKRDASLILVE